VPPQAIYNHCVRWAIRASLLIGSLRPVAFATGRRRPGGPTLRSLTESGNYAIRAILVKRAVQGLVRLRVVARADGAMVQTHACGRTR